MARLEQWEHLARCTPRYASLYDLDDIRPWIMLMGPDTTRDDVAEFLCTGCPVKQQCAMEALYPLVGDSVRAGIWIPVKQGNKRVRSSKAIQKIARGEADV